MAKIRSDEIIASEGSDTVGYPKCPRCGIGTPIFGDHCIVCCTVNDSIASLIKELLTQKLATEAHVRELEQERALTQRDNIGK
jgi:hypothetical protein